MTTIAAYAEECFREVERETGLSTGFRTTGSILVARTPGRWTEIQRGMSMAKTCGFDVEAIDGAEAKRLWPLMDESGIVGAAYLPADGVANPIDATQAIAKAFRLRGGQIFENTPVLEVVTRDGRVTGVRTDGRRCHLRRRRQLRGDVGARARARGTASPSRCTPPSTST